MVQPIYTHDIARYHRQIEQEGVQGAIKMYADLQDKGHGYAGWAKGVAEASGLNTGGFGGTITGRAAVLYMKNTSGREFSQAELNSIRVGMAKGYLAVLEENVKLGGGQTRTEVEYEQARDFHQKVFERHGLTIDNWTLETPMKLIGRYEGGKAAQEAQWQELMKTEGEYIEALFASNGLFGKVADYADGYISRSSRTGRVVTSYEMSDYAVYTNHKIDEADRKAARHWVSHVDLIKPLVMSRSEEMRHGYDDAEQTAAQARPLTMADMPEQVQDMCAQCRALLVEFDREEGVTRSSSDYDAISRSMAVQAYAAGLPEVQFIHVEENGQINIAYEAPSGMFKDTSIHTDKALRTSLEDSITQSKQAERDLALAAEQLAREIAEYRAQSYGGRSIG